MVSFIKSKFTILTHNNVSFLKQTWFDVQIIFLFLQQILRYEMPRWYKMRFYFWINKKYIRNSELRQYKITLIIESLSRRISSWIQNLLETNYHLKLLPYLCRCWARRAAPVQKRISDPKLFCLTFKICQLRFIYKKLERSTYPR